MLPLLLLLLLLHSGGTEASHADVKANPEQPDNPHLIIDSSRPETTYSGPAHPFPGQLGVYDASLKLIVESGEIQCYYYTLLPGFELHMYINTLSTRKDDVFDTHISDGDGNYITSFIYKSSVSYEMNITKADTYEICLYNPLDTKMLSFTTVYFNPSHHSSALDKIVKLSNISETATISLKHLEVTLPQALGLIRSQPDALRDLFTLRDCNSRVQLKAIINIVLMLVSFGGTTLFIRRLFDSPVSRQGV